MDDLRASLRLRWARMRLAYHTLSDLGLRTTGQVVAHTWRRRREAGTEWAGRTPTDEALGPGVLEEAIRIEGGARFVFTGAELEVVLVADDVVRFTWGPGDDPLPYAARVPDHWRTPAVSVHEDADAVALVGPTLEVRVWRRGEITVSRLNAGILRHELTPRRRGRWWEHRFLARPGERFSGLGEQAAGVDLRGGSFRLWNRDPGGAWGQGQVPLYMGIPVVLATHRGGDLLSFYDNPASAEVRFPSADDADGEVSVRFAGGVLRQYLMVGDVGSLLERYCRLTGMAALPPRWALGYHLSRWGYRTHRHVQAVLDGFREEGLPLSAVHLDIDYMDGYRVFTVDRRRFPDLGVLAGRAADQGTRLVAIVDPAVKVDHRYPLYRQGIEQQLFCTTPSGDVEVGVVWPGSAAFPDFTASVCRRWWSQQYRTLTEAGIGGVWHDMNEPTSISLVGDPTLHLSTRHHAEGRGADHAEVHNLYGLLMNEAGYAGLRQFRPERRPFVLSRSGWAGNQRWAWNWTGDVESSWAGLRQQVATVVGLGLSGIAFCGSDTGGFAGIPDPELYLRWLQMSVFMPLCRTHSVIGVPGREPWRFPEPARSAIAAWIRLRYRLLPYLYTLAHEAAASGAPLVRPLWWPAPSRDGDGDGVPAGGGGPPDGDADDTFLLGDALLVGTVTAPGTTERRVWLPPGTWEQWWASDGGATFSGAPSVPSVPTVRAPLERLPVFVRAGSVVVLDDGWAQPQGPCTLAHDDLLSGVPPTSGTVDLDHTPRLLAFHCWPLEGEAEGRCADDAGDGDGPARRDRLIVFGARAGGSAVVRWERSGDYPAPRRVRVVLHGLTAGAAAADGHAVEVRGGAVECGAFDELRLEGLRPG